MMFSSRTPPHLATKTISRLPLVIVLVVIAMAGAYLLLGFDMYSSPSCSTSALIGGPVYGVFQPNWHSLPVYNITANSLLYIIRGVFSVNITKSPLQMVIAMPATETGQFTANITATEGNGDLTYSLGPGGKTTDIPTSMGTMSVTYAISIPGGTPNGHYEVDLNLIPINAGCRDVGTQLPIQINVS